MNDKDFAPLTPICVKNLSDRLYEKRKTGAIEVERYIFPVHKDFPKLLI